jgi:hypothetical protein
LGALAQFTRFNSRSTAEVAEWSLFISVSAAREISSMGSRDSRICYRRQLQVLGADNHARSRELTFFSVASVSSWPMTLLRVLSTDAMRSAFVDDILNSLLHDQVEKGSDVELSK